MRTISLLILTLSLLLKFEVIHIYFIDNYLSRYILGFSIGFFVFCFLKPHADIFFNNKKKLNSDFVKKIAPELQGKNIDFFSADMIFKPNIVVLKKKRYSIFIDNKIIDNLSEAELRFFIFHEYSHIKDNDLLKIQLSTLIAFTVTPLFIFIVTSIIELPSEFLKIIPYMIIVIVLYLGGIILNFKYKRNRELKSDTYASNYVKKEDIINSFQKFINLNIFEKKKRSLLSSHPSLNERLKNLNISLKKERGI